MQETRMTTPQSNPCPPPNSNNLSVGMSPCSPPVVPLISPRMQHSPGPVYSPPTFVQTTLPSPASNYDHLEMLPVTPTVHSPLTVPRDAGLQPAISCENFENFGHSAQEMNTKDKDILQIVEQLLSPVSSESSAPPPPYSCTEVIPLYTSPSCDSTPSEGSGFPGKTML